MLSSAMQSKDMQRVGKTSKGMSIELRKLKKKTNKKLDESSICNWQ